MTDENNSMKTGTTVVGLLGDDYVILAADKRASMGKYIASHDVEKVKPLTDHIAVTTAGTVSTIQLVEKVARSRLRLKTLESKRKVKVKEAASLLTNINFRNMRTPFPEIASFLVGGFDDDGPHLFDVAPDGAMYELPDDTGYRAGGSGRMMAQSILDDAWEQGMSKDDAISLAQRAIEAAVQRDAGSGSGFYLAVIDDDGFQVVKDTETTPSITE
jgi:proteasome beta subunit